METKNIFYINEKIEEFDRASLSIPMFRDSLENSVNLMSLNVNKK